MEFGINSLDIYTDGAYSWKTNKGGWAFYIPQLNIKVTNQVNNTTNNRMELTAVLAVLQFIILLKINPLMNINIYTDSMYVKNCCKQKEWRHANLDLFVIYDYFQSLIKNPINFIFIKGHATSKENNIVDLLANLVSNL